MKQNHIFLILSILFISMNGFSQRMDTHLENIIHLNQLENITHLNQSGLKGQVKSIFMIDHDEVMVKNRTVKLKSAYPFSSKDTSGLRFNTGGEVTELWNSSYGQTNRWLNSYNQQGKLVEAQLLKNNMPDVKRVCTYDNDKHTAQETLYRVDGRILEIKNYTYDIKGNLIQEPYRTITHGYLIGNYVYTYNDKDQLIMTCIMENNDTSFVSLYTYNDQGLKTTETSADGSGFVKKTVNQYNEKRELVKTELYGNGKLQRTESFKYDAQGNIIETRSDWADNKGKQTYEYVYDTQGNWTQRTISTKGKPVKRMERIIAYY